MDGDAVLSHEARTIPSENLNLDRTIWGVGRRFIPAVPRDAAYHQSAMRSDHVVLVSGRCWWCDAPADSREHRLKKSDLVREFGKPPFTELRTLTRFSGGDRHEFRGPDSRLVKFRQSICTYCNNTRSQPFDVAWDRLASYLAKHEVEILRDRSLDLEAIFGTDWAARAADVERYVVKHLICRVAEQLPGPIRLHRKLLDFLDGGAYPTMLRLDLCIDLGVVEMLRVTRAAPPPEQPEAADGGFLGLTPCGCSRASPRESGQSRRPGCTTAGSASSGSSPRGRSRASSPNRLCRWTSATNSSALNSARCSVRGPPTGTHSRLSLGQDGCPCSEARRMPLAEKGAATSGCVSRSSA